MKQITEFGLGLTTTELYLRWEEGFLKILSGHLQSILERRLHGEPFQYITGREWFWESCFNVGPGVLIPRRETELIVETLLGRENRERVRIGELGAGSGNIGISLLLERPALGVARLRAESRFTSLLMTNRKAILPSEASYFVHADDFFSKAQGFAPYDWIVSNPPYVAREALRDSRVKFSTSRGWRLMAGRGEWRF